jgi:hypothetical protein
VFSRFGDPFVQPASIFLPWELELGAAIQVGPRPLNPRWLDPHEQEAHERNQIEQDRASRRAAQEAELRGIADPARMYDRASELAYQETFVRREEERRLDTARESLLSERKARYANWPRERITVLVEMLVSGRSPDAVGLESFFSHQASLAGMVAGTELKRSGQRISYSPRLGLEGEPVPDRLQTRIGVHRAFAFRRLARQHFTFGFDVKLLPWVLFGLAKDQVWRIGGVTDLAPRYQSFAFRLAPGIDGPSWSLIEIALVLVGGVALEERRRDLALERAGDLLLETLGGAGETLDVALVHEDARSVLRRALGGAEPVEQNERPRIDAVGNELDARHVAHVHRGVAHVAAQDRIEREQRFFGELVEQLARQRPRGAVSRSSDGIVGKCDGGPCASPRSSRTRPR